MQPHPDILAEVARQRQADLLAVARASRTGRVADREPVFRRLALRAAALVSRRQPCPPQPAPARSSG